MYVEAAVVVAELQRYAGMDAHAYPELHPGRDAQVGEGSLGTDCGRDGSLRTLENDEEGVTLSVDLYAPTPLNLLPHAAMMSFEQFAVSVTERLQESCGAVYVCKEECEGAGRQRHRDLLAAAFR